MDFSLTELQQALMAIIAAFPVYRTYMTEESDAPLPAEAAQIRQALESSFVKREINDPEVLSFIGGLLSLRPPPDLDTNGRDLCRKFVMRFQQLTGPVMAKGVEDTAFYNFNRFISLNEVGGDSGRFGISLESFHDQNKRRAQRWPHSLLASATHDTKRGEDLRARLNVLSEIPDEWGRAVIKWRGLNAEKKTRVNGQPAPSANDEYLLYQTLIGAWGTGAEQEKGRDHFRERLSDYMLKAVREAKAQTQWTEPNRPYEEAVERFIDALLCDSESNSFLDDFMLFQRKVAFFGLFNSLAQVVLKLTAPGVPDFYQGSELWDYNLVDPDNRRPVNYQARRKLLEEMLQKLSQEGVDLAGFLTGLLQNHQNGQIKMYLIWRILRLRAQRKALLEKGGYEPIPAVGAKKDHVCAFVRSSGNESVITVAARLVLTLAQGAQRGALDPAVWQDTTLLLAGRESEEKYRDVLTERVITVRASHDGLAVRDVLGLLPVAVLERVT
jgi:(1->4)-alpha-D-glucan 1-alpha-D-glucosylmutase